MARSARVAMAIGSRSLQESSLRFLVLADRDLDVVEALDRQGGSVALG